MKKQILLTAIFIIALSLLYAQSTNPFAQKVDSITANLDKNYITTGVLYDRTPQLASLDLFNPLTDTSDFYLFTQAYFEMFQAAYSINGWQSPGLSDSIIWDNNVSGIVPIGVLDYQYNMLIALLFRITFYYFRMNSYMMLQEDQEAPIF